MSVVYLMLKNLQNSFRVGLFSKPIELISLANVFTK